MKEKKIILGISGFIASGKTEAGKYLEKLGAGFVEADDVVNGLYRQGGEGYRKISSYFGTDFLKKNGEINRKKLARFVFGDIRKLKILNSLIHPLVHSEIRKIIGGKKESIVAVEAAYFEKNGLGGLVDRIIWIECPRTTLKRRAMRSNGVSAEMFGKIISSQSRPERIDFVVDNGGSKAELHGQIREIYNEIQS